MSAPSLVSAWELLFVSPSLRSQSLGYFSQETTIAPYVRLFFKNIHVPTFTVRKTQSSQSLLAKHVFLWKVVPFKTDELVGHSGISISKVFREGPELFFNSACLLSRWTEPVSPALEQAKTCYSPHSYWILPERTSSSGAKRRVFRERPYIFSKLQGMSAPSLVINFLGQIVA